MLTSRPNSYQNTHARRQNYDKLQAQLRVCSLSVLACRLPFSRKFRLAGLLQDAENVHPDKLLTDRSTYIGYLESQLERVTNACLTVQLFDQRIETVTSAARLLEEKVPVIAAAAAVTWPISPWHQLDQPCPCSLGP